MSSKKTPDHLIPVQTEKFDPGDLSERTKDLLAKEFGEDADAPPPVDAVEEAILSGQPVPSVHNAGLAGVPTSAEELLPTLKNLFEGKDYLIKEFFPQGIADQIDTGIGVDHSKVRVKKIVEPDDIYDERLDPRKERLFYEIFFGQLAMPGQVGQKTVGDEIAINVKRMATGSGVPLVSWLRQKLWPVLSRNKVRVLNVPKDRTPADDLEDPRDIPNIKLRMLLEWSLYEQLQDLGRLSGNECSNITAFREVMKQMHDQGYVHLQ